MDVSLSWPAVLGVERGVVAHVPVPGVDVRPVDGGHEALDQPGGRADPGGSAPGPASHVTLEVAGQSVVKSGLT